MSKVIVEDLDGTIKPFTVEIDPITNDRYTKFHSTVGVVLGNIAAEMEGLEDVSAMFDDGSNIDTDRKELAAGLFYYTDSGNPICCVTLVE